MAYKIIVMGVKDCPYPVITNTCIQASLFAVNFADDKVAPPELKIMEIEIVKVKQGRYILHPITEQTNGHSTCFMPEIWGVYLKELLKVLS